MALPECGCIRAFPSSFERSLVVGSVTERPESHAFDNKLKIRNQAAEVVLFLNCTHACRPFFENRPDLKRLN